MCMANGSILGLMIRSKGNSGSSYAMVSAAKWATRCVSACGCEWGDGLWYQSLFGIITKVAMLESYLATNLAQ